MASTSFREKVACCAFPELLPHVDQFD